jgi:glycosyltransferase involved in cell wall biosynthesis
VVIPCFNEGAAVAEAWCSLTDEEPHEAVIVDDGSTDPTTLDVLNALREAGARVIRQDNGGLAAARAAGVAATRAPYVQPLDGDDIIVPGALSRLADALDSDGDAVAAWGDLRIFGTIDRIDPKGNSVDPWLLTYLHDLHSSLMIRRTALEEIGGWNRVVFEDWDVSLAIAERGWSGIYVAGAHIFYRVDDGGMLASAPLERGLAELRSRHPGVFAGRRRNARASRAPGLVKRAFPLIAASPFMSASRKIALQDALLRRLDSRRQVQMPEPGSDGPVVAAKNAARALLASPRQAGVSRQ